MQRSIQLHLTWLKYCKNLLITSKQFVEDRKKAFVANPSDVEHDSLAKALKDVAQINDDILHLDLPEIKNMTALRPLLKNM